MSSAPPYPQRNILVTLVGVIMLLLGLAYLGFGLFAIVQGEQVIKILNDAFAKAEAEGAVKIEGKDAQEAKEGFEKLLRGMILFVGGCLGIWGALMAFAGYRVTARKGRVLAIIFGVLMVLGNGGALAKGAQGATPITLAITGGFLAYGLLTVIILIMRGEEFQG